MFIGIVMRIKIKFMIAGREHLCNRVFIQHALVHIQPITEYLLIDFIFKKFIFVKSMAYKKSGIT